MTRATRLVIFWAIMFVLASPGSFLGWRWSVGLFCGLFLAWLFQWRRSWPSRFADAERDDRGPYNDGKWL